MNQFKNSNWRNFVTACLHRVNLEFLKMGLLSSKTQVFSRVEMDEYEQLTYLTKRQILYVFKRFRLLAPEVIDANRMDRLSLETLYQLPELMYNPFKDRIYKVFSSSPNGTLNFEDFLDMISVFSENAPRIIKSEYVFKIFDFDDDNEISTSDIEELVRRICGKGNMTDSRIKDLARILMSQADLEDDGKISFLEFEHLVAKSKEFETLIFNIIGSINLEE